MSVTIKNVSTGYISVPRPFMTTLAAGASVTRPGVSINGIAARPRQKLQDLANAGKITISEFDELLARGTPADANTADIHQILSVGQGTAADGSVEAVTYVERPCYLQEVTCFFDAVPAVTETITIDLKRNGQSILSAALVVDNTSTIPSESATLLADDENNTDGAVLTADPDEFSSAGATFTDAHIGNLLFLNSGGSNDGVYIISARTDANNVDCTYLNGTAASFTDESGIEWDMYLSLQKGDVLSLTATVANTTNLNYWACNAIMVPR